jgi:hypothetical protein
LVDQTLSVNSVSKHCCVCPLKLLTALQPALRTENSEEVDVLGEQGGQAGGVTGVPRVLPPLAELRDDSLVLSRTRLGGATACREANGNRHYRNTHHVKASHRLLLEGTSGLTPQLTCGRLKQERMRRIRKSSDRRLVQRSLAGGRVISIHKDDIATR